MLFEFFGYWFSMMPKRGNYIMLIDICIVCHHQKGGNCWGMRKHEVCSFDGWQRIEVLITNKESWCVTNHWLSSSKRGKMLGSRRTNNVVLMIDKVKAWCRMCTIMRDCGKKEKVQNCKEGNKWKKLQFKWDKERSKYIQIQEGKGF